MSFLSSHRLHWGVHHELSDNFRIQLEQIAHDAKHLIPTASDDTHDVVPAERIGASTDPLNDQPRPEALGP